MTPLCLSCECCIFSKITFYSQTASESWNSPLTLTIDEVDDTTYDSYNAPDKSPKTTAPQGHKNPTLMPLRGVFFYPIMHHGGVAPA
ncbi:MAG: hypothetical protein IKN29_06750 [Bacteroidales bacterium]|nr:hypothetical protein [Bacteroidales bacterium]